LLVSGQCQTLAQIKEAAIPRCSMARIHTNGRFVQVPFMFGA